MSNYGWQKGEFKLPTAEFTRLRKRLEDVDRGTKDAVFKKTQEFWKGLTAKQKTDRTAYAAAVHDFGEKLARDNQRAWGNAKLNDDVLRAIDDKLGEIGGLWHSGRAPRRVLQADMDFPTNRTTEFSADSVTISFDRDTSTVAFDIDENNHSVDRAHETQLLSTFIGEIESMKWTRGTGGRVWGDNEYAADARREYGYDSDMTSSSYGPIGAEGWPERLRPWIDAQGMEHRLTYKTGRGGHLQARVEKGVPRGGQFAGRYRGESGVSLR